MESFGDKKKPVSEPPTTNGDSSRAPRRPPLIDLEDELRKVIVTLCLNDVGQREINGKNRSPMIDLVNKEIGVSLGSPYCISAILIRGVKPAIKILGLKVPSDFKFSASTQLFFNASKLHVRPRAELAKRGDIAIWRQKANPALGHAGLVRSDQQVLASFDSVQYNTSSGAAEERDGEGVYEKPASTIDSKKWEFRGFIDVCGWIVRGQERKLA